LRKFTFQLQIDRLCTIQTDAADRLIESRNGDAALVYLYLVRTGGVLDEAEIKKQFGYTDGRLESAIACILRTGCVSEITAETEQKVIPSRSKQVLPEVTEATYTPAELQRGLREDPMFKWLCHEAESRLGRVLKQFELETLYSIYDYLAMPAEVIVMLIGYLTSSREERVAKGFTTPAISFRQISREASRWSENGINTAEKADAHIKYLQYRKSVKGQLLQALGIRDRLPSPSEETMLNRWIDAGSSVDLIAKAYDLTVMQKGALNWHYMRSIVDKWLARGYRTAADVDAGEKKPSSGSAAAQGSLDNDYAQRILQHKKKTQTEQTG